MKVCVRLPYVRPLTILFVWAVLLVNQALADPINQGPPAGPVILDLNGTPVPQIYTEYSVSFQATEILTNISFAFRDDNTFLFLDDVSVVDTTTASGNLLLNGGFEDGPQGVSAPTDWTYLNTFGADFGGMVGSSDNPYSTGGPHSGLQYYIDGAVQAYDGITQAIATNPGDKYTIDFWLDEGLGTTTFSELSTNGDTTDDNGNGIDVVVYAGAIPGAASAVPEPASMVLFSLAAFALLSRRKNGYSTS